MATVRGGGGFQPIRGAEGGVEESKSTSPETSVEKTARVGRAAIAREAATTRLPRVSESDLAGEADGATLLESRKGGGSDISALSGTGESPASASSLVTAGARTPSPTDLLLKEIAATKPISTGHLTLSPEEEERQIRTLEKADEVTPEMERMLEDWSSLVMKDNLGEIGTILLKETPIETKTTVFRTPEGKQLFTHRRLYRVEGTPPHIATLITRCFPYEKPRYTLALQPDLGEDSLSHLAETRSMHTSKWELEKPTQQQLALSTLMHPKEVSSEVTAIFDQVFAKAVQKYPFKTVRNPLQTPAEAPVSEAASTRTELKSMETKVYPHPDYGEMFTQKRIYTVQDGDQRYQITVFLELESGGMHANSLIKVSREGTEKAPGYGGGGGGGSSAAVSPASTEREKGFFDRLLGGFKSISEIVSSPLFAKFAETPATDDPTSKLGKQQHKERLKLLKDLAASKTPIAETLTPPPGRETPQTAWIQLQKDIAREGKVYFNGNPFTCPDLDTPQAVFLGQHPMGDIEAFQIALKAQGVTPDKIDDIITHCHSSFAAEASLPLFQLASLGLQPLPICESAARVREGLCKKETGQEIRIDTKQHTISHSNHFNLRYPDNREDLDFTYIGYKVEATYIYNYETKTSAAQYRFYQDDREGLGI